MPLIDSQLVLAWEVALAQTGSTGAQFSTSVELDFETTVLPPSVAGGSAAVAAQTQAYPDKGAGSPLVVRFLITTVVAGGTSIAFCLCFDTTTQTGNNALSSSTSTIVARTGPIAIATLVAGYTCELAIPDQHARFMNVNTYVIGTVSSGNFTAWIDIARGLRHR
jgi:hypothetical protein